VVAVAPIATEVPLAPRTEMTESAWPSTSVSMPVSVRSPVVEEFSARLRDLAVRRGASLTAATLSWSSAEVVSSAAPVVYLSLTT
jgi:hypothetical protein